MLTLLGEFRTYDAFDLLTILTLIVLEGLLSVDNALVLATIVRKIPRVQQRKALTYGVWGAIVFRIVAILLATQIIKLNPVKLIGGGYLVYLAFNHMFPSRKLFSQQKEEKKATHLSFWRTVLIVELTDIAFSIDSIATAVAITDKITVIMLGGIAGIIAMRFVAVVFIRLLEKFPTLDDIAYQLIFFVGIKLALGCFNIHIESGTFWMVAGLIVLIGVSSMYQQRISSAMGEKITADLITSHSEDYIVEISQQKVSIAELLEKNYNFSSDFLRYLIKNGYLEYSHKAKMPDLKKASEAIYTKQPIEEDNPNEAKTSGDT